LWILLIAFVAVAALYLLKKFKRLDGPAKRNVWIESLFLVGAVVAVLVLARFGMQWIGLLIAGAWALFRTIGPHVLRLRPLFQGGAEAKKRPQQREQAASNKAKPKELMSRAEALQVLGVEEGASREAILVAYRNLIRKVHPDSPGGSNYLAAKLNQAKDVLLS
jgi:hypothetical protein